MLATHWKRYGSRVDLNISKDMRTPRRLHPEELVQYEFHKALSVDVLEDVSVNKAGRAPDSVESRI